MKRTKQTHTTRKHFPGGEPFHKVRKYPKIMKTNKARNNSDKKREKLEEKRKEDTRKRKELERKQRELEEKAAQLKLNKAVAKAKAEQERKKAEKIREERKKKEQEERQQRRQERKEEQERRNKEYEDNLQENLRKFNEKHNNHLNKMDDNKENDIIIEEETPEKQHIDIDSLSRSASENQQESKQTHNRAQVPWEAIYKIDPLPNKDVCTVVFKTQNPSTTIEAINKHMENNWQMWELVSRLSPKIMLDIMIARAEKDPDRKQTKKELNTVIQILLNSGEREAANLVIRRLFCSMVTACRQGGTRLDPTGMPAYVIQEMAKNILQTRHLMGKASKEELWGKVEEEIKQNPTKWLTNHSALAQQPRMPKNKWLSEDQFSEPEKLIRTLNNMKPHLEKSAG